MVLTAAGRKSAVLTPFTNDYAAKVTTGLLNHGFIKVSVSRGCVGLNGLHEGRVRGPIVTGRLFGGVSRGPSRVAIVIGRYEGRLGGLVVRGNVYCLHTKSSGNSLLIASKFRRVRCVLLRAGNRSYRLFHLGSGKRFRV